MWAKREVGDVWGSCLKAEQDGGKRGKQNTAKSSALCPAPPLTVHTCPRRETLKRAPADAEFPFWCRSALSRLTLPVGAQRGS